MNGSNFTPKQHSFIHEGEMEDHIDTIDLRDLVGVIWREKITIIMAIAVCSLAGMYYATSIATPIYKASSLVMMRQNEKPVVDLGSVVSGVSIDTAAINTEVQVLRSRNLLGTIVDDLSLADDPEFNSRLRVESEFRKIFDFLSGGTEEFDGEASDPFEEKKIRDSVISALRSKVSAFNIGQSYVIQVDVLTANPQKSAIIADTLVEAYIYDQISEKFEDTENATTWLTNRVADLQADLEVAERKLSDFRTSTALISQETLSARERQLKDVRDRISTIGVDLKSADDLIEMIQNNAPMEDILEQSGDPVLNSAIERGATSEIQGRLEALLEEAQRVKLRSESQLNILNKSADELRQENTRQGNDLIELQQLTREAEASRLLYEYFLTRLKETSAQQGVQEADSRQLSNAVIPSFPHKPRRTVILAMSAVVGFLFGAAVVLWREGRRNTFRTAAEVERKTGYQVLGQLPLVNIRSRRALLRYYTERPASAAAEAVRNLRTTLLMLHMDRPPQVIVMTSPLPGEGKTTTSLALAQNLADMGRKVLVIEGDTRRRTFGDSIRVVEADGNLIKLIQKEARLENSITRSDLVGTDVISSGKSDTPSADLFYSSGFQDLMRDLRGIYDHIVIDTPPVLLVPDAKIIATHADACLMVVKWDASLQDQTTAAIQQIDRAGVKVSGVVLNQISAKGMKRYGYGGVYGSYERYGGKYYIN